MMNEESMFFPKQIKLDDYEPPTQQNIVRIMETSNLLLGNGGKSSSTSIIMSKALHFMQEEGSLNLAGKRLLEFGSGAGFLGIYLGCIGANVLLTDLPPIKEMAQKNINLNRDLLKAEIQFSVLNWKTIQKYKSNKNKKEGQIEMEIEEKVSTSSSDLSQIKGIDQIDFTIACEAGNIDDFAHQLQLIGKEGMIVGFRERSYEYESEYLSGQEVERYLLENSFEYEKLQNYHPDYIDERVSIYWIWK